MNKLIPIGTIIALAITFGIVQAQVKSNEKSIDEEKVKTAKHAEKISEGEVVDMKQTTILEALAKQMEKLDTKLDNDLKKKPNR